MFLKACSNMQRFSARRDEAISAEEYLFRTYKSAAYYEEETLWQDDVWYWLRMIRLWGPGQLSHQ